MDKETIFKEAYERCLTEMYAKSQPPADYHQLVEDLKSGKITEDEHPIYTRHYLSQKEFEYILDKYTDAYRLKEHWKSNINFLLDNFKEGALKDVYKNNSLGNPYKTVERMKPLKELIGEEHYNIVKSYIEAVRDFYKFDRDESDFHCNIALGCSPTCNAKTVIEYWKSQGVDITIEERNPDTFWYRDEYGENWEEFYNEDNN